MDAWVTGCARPLVAASEQAAEMSAESRTILANGREMHYRLCIGLATPGRSPVVLVHGLVASSRYMAPLIAKLAPDFDVYTPDLPGFGKSWKPRKVLGITALADALAAERKSTRLNSSH